MREVTCVRYVSESGKLYARLFSVVHLGYANNETIHKAVENTYQRHQLDMRKSCVSAAADGASVNFGQLTGVMTRMSKYLPWILPIHCSAHKLELAIKDAYVLFLSK